MLDKFRSTSITWDKATRRIYSPITANESDSNGRKLNIQVVNSGQVENLTGATLHLYWETKDKAQHGLDAFTASDISKGEFEIFYTTGMLSNVGELNATLVLVDGTGKVVSDWFKITVTRGINESAIESENSFSSLTQALIDISNLEQNYAPRLNDLTAQLQQTEQELSSQLQQKATKGHIKGIDFDISSDENKVKLVNLADEVKQAMVGNTPINASVANEGVTSEKLARGSVVPHKIKGQYSVGKNLFNKYDIVPGKRIDPTTGDLLDYAQLYTSNYIPVSENTSYALSVSGERVFYDSDKTFISSLTGADPNNFTTPPNSAFMRFSLGGAYIDSAQLELGSITTSIENYKFKVRGLNTEDPIYVHAVVTFENTDRLYCQQGGLSPKNIYLKFDSVTLRYLNSYITFTLDQIAVDIDPYYIKTSVEGVTGCVFLPEGYGLYYDVNLSKFVIKHFSVYDTNHISIVRNSAGFVSGVFADAINGQTYLDNKSFSTFKQKYFDIVRAKENEVIALQNNSTFCFGFSTDMHVQEWERGWQNETYNTMERVAKNVNVDAIFNTGDSISYGRSDKSIGLEALKHNINKLSMKEKLYHGIGNHDYNGRSDAPNGKQRKSWTITPFETYTILGKHHKDSVVWGSREYMYFYKDFEDKKIRVIFLNTSDVPFNWLNDGEDYLQYDPLIIAGIREEQAQWLANKALNFSAKTDKAEWHTLIIQHVGLYREEDGLTWNNQYVENDYAIRTIINGFMTGSSKSIQHTDTKYNGIFTLNFTADFTSQGSMPFIGIFSGHNHLDRNVKSVYGLNQITTTAGYPDYTIINKDPGMVRTPNDYSEIALDIVTIDKLQKKIIMKRFGAGADREFTY